MSDTEEMVATIKAQGNEIRRLNAIINRLTAFANQPSISLTMAAMIALGGVLGVACTFFVFFWALDWQKMCQVGGAS